LYTIIVNAQIKKSIRNVGSINEIKETDPKISISSLVMPKSLRIEYTVSIYATIVPKITSIHAASLIFGHNKIAKKAAAAPRTS